MAGSRDRFLTPTLRFRNGVSQVQQALSGMAAKLGVSRRNSDRAVREAFSQLQRLNGKLIRSGSEALNGLAEHNRMGIVLIARPYTLYDSGVNLNIPRKLRDIYGIDCIPMDFLDLDDINIRSEHDNMFWDYGRRILQAARFVGDHPHLHLIFLTNFKCGPDSFIQHFVESISGKPFLTLQLDEHGNDAGALTRCEAYLESKGFLQ
ncbi:MAG: acyl-CoA dehydratase activase-related protein [Acidobacteriota bacterium]